MNFTVENCEGCLPLTLPGCSAGMGKSLARASATEKLDIHTHQTTGETVHVSSDNLRINHYYTRSERDVELKAAKWNKDDPITVFKEANDYWTAIEDRSLQRYEAALEQRMYALRT